MKLLMLLLLLCLGFFQSAHCRIPKYRPPFNQTSASIPKNVSRNEGIKLNHARPALDGDGVSTAGGWEPDLQPNPVIFETHRAKGAFILCLLAVTDAEAGQAWPDPYNRNPKSARSQFRSSELLNELGRWAWQEGASNQDEDADFSWDDKVKTDKIPKALAALGINTYPRTMGGNNVHYSIQHYDDSEVDEDGDVIGIEDQDYVVNGIMYYCTGAYYRFVINHADGAIFAQNLNGPKHAADENWFEEPQLPVTAAKLPRIRQFSDVMMAYWLKGNPRPKYLRYFFVTHIMNDETMDIITKILKDAPEVTNKEEVPYWPGVTRDIDSPEGQALLGSPLGMSLAYMLLQYKEELGIKSVEDVTIFRDDHPQHVLADVELVFRIRDVPWFPPDDNDDEVSEHLQKRDGHNIIVREHKINLSKL